MIEKVKFEAPSIKERETILRYDDVDKMWHVYSDVPKHIRRYEKLLDEENSLVKGYDHTGRLTMIDGVLNKNGRLHLGEKRQLSEDEKMRLREQLKRIREK